jgi:hypothetical protein
MAGWPMFWMRGHQNYVYESEHERLNVVEDILIKIIKMSDIESVPQIDAQCFEIGCGR